MSATVRFWQAPWDPGGVLVAAVAAGREEVRMSSDIWGPLSERYRSERPRRLLALDGGGIRGVLTLGILREMETELAAVTKKGSAFRLCDFFDYIAGTSTGAIIAGGLARGMSTKELIAFYTTIGPEMFQKERLLRRIRHMYKSASLANQLKAT